MKQFMSILAGLAVGAGLSAVAQAAPAENALAELRNQHIQHQRVVRRAVRVCAHHPSPTFGRFNHANVCVIGEVERYVASEEGESIRAFHQQLPWRYRYDEARSFGQVQRFFN